MKPRRLPRRTLISLLVLSILTFASLIFALRSDAQIGSSQSPVWNLVSEAQLPPAPAGTRIIVPERYQTVALNTTALRTLLAGAPMEFTPQANGSGRVEIKLPMPDGTMARFRAEESPIMEPALAARHPEIKTYRAQGVDDPAATARFGITSAGFHAIILSPSGAYYIDPYRRGDAVNHISYFKRDFPRTDAHRFECQLLPFKDSGKSLTAESASTMAATRPNGGTLRTYRLAFAADFEYSDFHSDAAPVPDKADVLANGIIPATNRVNGIYEREVAVHMNLVADEELIIFNTPADPYQNDNGTSMLATNQATCDSLIGPLNYDIGHVASTGGGGVAFLGVVCSVQKAGGVTGLPAPTGDPYYVDYVAHEMGHQFGGNHTFNGSTGSCGGNANTTTGYEVGSGSTIMAYAGICSPQNTQLNSDDNFHTVSYDEILNHITNPAEADACAVKTATGNTPPTVDAGTDFNIPARTPFTLTATGSDADGDALSYAWEEFDLGPPGPGRPDNGTSPILRAFSPTTSPSRTFPSLKYILDNANPSDPNQPPETYQCGIRTCITGELLPTTNRALKFRVTARDNRVGGGGVEYDLVQVNVTAAAGPFVVSSPNGGETWDANTTETVTWDVAGTSAAPISATQVDIHLSTDGGQTFPILLADNVDNDGTQDLLIPAVSTAKARVRVSASGNIFFDVSNADFLISPPPLAPVAVNDSATTAFQTPVSIAVLANDSDPDSFALSILSIQSPTNAGGTATIDDNGTPGNTTDDRILYTPPPQFSGSDQFGYTITDGGLTASATVTVTVNSFCPPTPTGNFIADFEAVPPNPDGFTVQTPLNEASSAPWTIVSDPGAHSPTMSFYTDNAGVQGLSGKSDRLISPPQLISSTSRLIFWHRFLLEQNFDGGVLEVSTNGGASYVDILAAGGIFVTGGYNNNTMDTSSPLAGRMVWSGTSPTWPATMNKVEVNLGALAGTTAIFRWHFRADSLNIDAAVGWYVDDIQFTNLLVSPPCNEPPFAISQSVSTNEDTPVGITLTANQGDDSDTLTFTVLSGPAHGTLTGSVPNLTYTPAANYNGGDSFTFRANDGTHNSNIATVTITVQSVNDPPLAGDDTATVFEGSGPNVIDVLRNDSTAPEDGEALSIQSVTQGANGVVAIIDGGSALTYAPNGGFSGADIFTYTVSDGNGGLATASVRVTVVDINGPVNYALISLGSVPSASSTASSRNYSTTSAFDGEIAGANWEQGGGWNDNTRGVWPDSLTVTFGGGAKTINEIRVYTLQNNFSSPVNPDATTDASVYGIQDFEVQAFNSSTGQFETVAGGMITGNTKALRAITLGAPVTTTAVRIKVNMGRVFFSRIVELEAYGPPGQ